MRVRDIVRQTVMFAVLLFVVGLAACGVDEPADGKCTGDACTLAQDLVTAGMDESKALEIQAKAIEVPKELQLASLDGGGAKTNTECTAYAGVDCAVWLADDWEKARLCTQGCGGPAVCNITWIVKVHCGSINPTTGVCGGRDTSWYNPSQCATMRYTDPCTWGDTYFQTGRCVRETGAK